MRQELAGAAGFAGRQGGRPVGLLDLDAVEAVHGENNYHCRRNS